MNTLYAPLILLAFCMTFACSEPFSEDSAATIRANHPNSLTQGDSEDESVFDKRVDRYAFGLGRRAYTYTNGGNDVKRFPEYNFGLGKRAVPYSFGLGKRFQQYEDEIYPEYERLNFDPAFYDGKRNRPYSFGLGKRAPTMNDNERNKPLRFAFGLGRR